MFNKSNKSRRVVFYCIFHYLVWMLYLHIAVYRKPVTLDVYNVFRYTFWIIRFGEYNFTIVRLGKWILYVVKMLETELSVLTSRFFSSPYLYRGGSVSKYCILLFSCFNWLIAFVTWIKYKMKWESCYVINVNYYTNVINSLSTAGRDLLILHCVIVHTNNQTKLNSYPLDIIIAVQSRYPMHK